MYDKNTHLNQLYGHLEDAHQARDEARDRLAGRVKSRFESVTHVVQAGLTAAEALQAHRDGVNQTWQDVQSTWANTAALEKTIAELEAKLE